MSGAAFAEHCGLNYQTFAGWIAKRKREAAQGEHPKGGQQFVLAEFGAIPAPASGELRVELPGCACAQLASAGQAVLLDAWFGLFSESATSRIRATDHSAQLPSLANC